ALGAVGGPEQAAVVERALADDDAGVRAAAGRTVGMWARRKLAVPPGARAALRKLAGDGDAEVRYAAAYGMALQPDGDEDLLAGLAGDADAEVRAMALRGLGARGAGSPDLWARGLADANIWVKVEAVRALTGAKATPAQLAQAAAFVGPEPSHAVREALTRLQAHAADPAVRAAFERVGAAATDATVRCLAAAGGARGGAPLAVLEGCGGPEWARAQLLAQVIADGHGAADAKLRLWRAFADARDVRLRAASVHIGVKLGDPAIASSVLEHAIDDRSSAVVEAALEHLDGASEDVLAALVARATEETDPELAGGLLEEIGKRKPPGGERAVARGLAAKNPAIRAAARAAAKAMGQTVPDEPATVQAPPADPLVRARRLRVDTSRGSFTIELVPSLASWNVSHIVALARRGFYDGTVCHRVVPDFVVQCGDPTATGSGGSGVSIPAEPSAERYVRGTAGIADAGKDTGDSQWFVMHSPAPHLEGRYTVIGHVPAADQRVVDALQVGDTIDRVVVEE
ncbi:MAG TPA: peptidylprolyl isomerase, partial [Haliangiales bacterium]|nr:peptidylprolyl isomerase [Haliangiales bacterium]